MVRYLLDSNIIIAARNNTSAPLLSRLTGLSPERLGLSSIVLGELLTGVEKSGNAPKNRAELALLTEGMEGVPFDAGDAAAYSVIRAYLEKRGETIGQIDLFIAGQAVNRGLVLVTANLREFRRVPNLKCENWLK